MADKLNSCIFFGFAVSLVNCIQILSGMKNTFVVMLMLFGMSAFAQNFEGEIVYANTYKSKSALVSDEQLTSMMGSKQYYFMKGADYKSLMNGKLVEWQLYLSKENKIYNKMSASETVYWNDASVNDDEVLKSEVHKEATTILGYKCDELVLTCKSGVQKYYFNSKLAIDAKMFVKHKFGNWYAFLEKANAVPLKMTVDNAQFSMESVATEIKPGKLEDKTFVLAAGTKTEKSPY